jgi:hypothetical protein
MYRKCFFIGLLIAALFLFSRDALCESVTAQMISVKGEVLVRPLPGKTLEEARLYTPLAAHAQIVTKKNAECIITFGTKEEILSTVSVTENSSVTLSDLFPTNLLLFQGRVFALVRKADTQAEFKVRTPTAVAGARGTGLGVGFNGTNTQTGCFENTIFVQGLDDQGNSTGEQDVGEGFGLDVGQGGVFGQQRELTDQEKKDWQNFLNGLNSFSQGGDPDFDDESFDQQDGWGTRNETQGTFRDFMQERNRKDKEDNAPSQESSSSSGGQRVITKE